MIAGAWPVIALWAQNEEDALRLAYTRPGGTARSAAMANAFGALGADPVSAMLNPAGLGLYVASEISITPAFEVNDASSLYYGSTSGGTASRFHMSDMALIMNTPMPKGSTWRSGTFGIVFDRIASFHWDQQAMGDVRGSIVDAFVNEANGTPSDLLDENFPFTSFLAWETRGINLDTTVTNGYLGANPPGTLTRQQPGIRSEGATNNTSFFYAANYDDRFYIGAAIGVVGTHFTRYMTHGEVALEEGVPLRSLTYQEDLTTRGNGIDVKVGAILRAAERWRIGAAFHSPMWMNMNDAFYRRMTTSFGDGTGHSSTSPDGIFSYRINTPMSLLFSLAYVVGQHGAVSVDYEVKDYGRTRLRRSDELADPYDFSAENAALESTAALSQSVRVGTEWRADPWYFRGGWGYWPDPYASTDARHGLPLTQYAAGLGWRNQRVSLDLGFTYAQRGTGFFPYDPLLVEPVEVTLTSYRGLLTIAYRP